MKKIAFLFFMMLVATFSFASTNDYRINNDKVDALFANAVEVNLSQMSLTNNAIDGLTLSAPFALKGEKKAVVAFVLAWVLGSLGIHRLYLGTATLTFVGYILTCGGFGIVALVDWIVLLLALVDNGDISKYIDNPKFFMW